MTAPPGDATYVKLVYRVLDLIGDQSDPDHDPDWVTPPTGTTVTIKYPVVKILDPGGAPPATFYPRPVVCAVDPQGYLLDPQGNQGVWIVDPRRTSMQPNNFTLTVEVAVPGRSTDTFNVALTVPNGDGSFDLTLNSPVPSSPGVAVTQGPAGARGSLWYTSGNPYADYADVPDPAEGDQFLYPGSGDLFNWHAGVWSYSGSIKGPPG
jgi:hypothetical protein